MVYERKSLIKSGIDNLYTKYLFSKRGWQSRRLNPDNKGETRSNIQIGLEDFVLGVNQNYCKTTEEIAYQIAETFGVSADKATYFSKKWTYQNPILVYSGDTLYSLTILRSKHRGYVGIADTEKLAGNW